MHITPGAVQEQIFLGSPQSKCALLVKGGGFCPYFLSQYPVSHALQTQLQERAVMSVDVHICASEMRTLSSPFWHNIYCVHSGLNRLITGVNSPQSTYFFCLIPFYPYQLLFCIVILRLLIG